jgi:hypothetical protein
MGLGLETSTVPQVATAENADGRPVAKISAEYSLGAARAGARDDDDTLVVAAGADGASDKARVEVEYGGGTACDVGEGEVPRATTARLVCGDTTALVSVVEDRTCHYVFTVTSPALCAHAAFAVAANARPVTCERGAP